MSISDEEIVAFLIGDADESLASRIRASLPHDQELAQRVSHFRQMLSYLDEAAEFFEPPGDLIDKTMQRVEAVASQAGDQSPRRVLQPAGYSRLPDNRASWLDSVALTLSLTVLCCLALPALVRVRHESRKAQCAENLRLNGLALIEFAIRSANQRYPAVAGSGPEAFSGIYAVRLHNVGLLQSAQQIRCASLLGIERPLLQQLSHLPTLQQLRTASHEQLVQWQRLVGGDYAYNLGVLEKRHLVAPRNTGSSHFALLADAPLMEGDSDILVAHDGRGVNILYDDGHVSFVNHRFLNSYSTADDHPFRNRLGDRHAGVDTNDASLGPSWAPPLGR